MRHSLDKVCQKVADSVRQGCNLIIISDRGVSKDRAAIPSLLAVSGIHHYLIRADFEQKQD